MWNNLPSDEIINKTVSALKANGMDVVVVSSGAEAKTTVLSLIPEKAEVMTMTSVTLDSIGIPHELDSSGRFDSVRSKFAKMDRATQGAEMQKLGAAPAWVVGSVHAITTDGQVVVASNTGSQLPAYAYSSSRVVWVVGAQKLVEGGLPEAMKRVYEHVLPLESERAKKAYGVPGSFVSKLLIVNKEVQPGRITVVIVKESLGF